MTYSDSGRVIVAIDGDNTLATLQKLSEDIGGKKIDLVELIKFVVNGSKPVDIFMYISVEDDGSWPTGLHGFAYALKQQGIRIIPVPKIIVGTNEGRPVRKGYEDLEVMLEILEYNETQYDRLVLFAGDSDFARFAGIMRKRVIRVEVATQNANTNDWLLKECNLYYNLRELIKEHPELIRG